MKEITKEEIKSLSNFYKIREDLLTTLITWFGKDEILKILKMRPHNLKKTARVNLMNLKRIELIKRLRNYGIIANPIKDINAGIEIIKGGKKIGSCLDYLKGNIMPQGFGSILSVVALDPRPGDYILDMAASPGGKSCFIGEKMQGKGLLISNEINNSRILALENNLSRHNINNVIIMRSDASKIKLNNFDRILLDAPCTGEGLIISDPKRKISKSIQNNFIMQKLQVQLLKHAIKMLKEGGICVYSTCSLTPYENEYVLKEIENQVEILEIKIPGENGFNINNENLMKTKRLLPSKFNCDGFFIAKMRKL